MASNQLTAQELVQFIEDLMLNDIIKNFIQIVLSDSFRLMQGVDKQDRQQAQNCNKSELSAKKYEKCP
jgi:hypothetical protein